jgi:Protease inhibitor Inh
MRRLLLALAVVGLAGPAAAEMDTNLMDLSEGAWTLSAGAATCQITLGDDPVEGGRSLAGGSECRDIDSSLDQATKWRIDTPGELIFLSDGGRDLARLHYDENKEFFTGIAAGGAPLILAPSVQ